MLSVGLAEALLKAVALKPLAAVNGGGDVWPSNWAKLRELTWCDDERRRRGLRHLLLKVNLTAECLSSCSEEEAESGKTFLVT